MSPAAAVSPIASRLPTIGSDAAHAARLLHDLRNAAVWRAIDPSLAIVAAAAPEGGDRYLLRLACDAGDVAVVLAAPGDVALALVAADDLGDALRALAAHALFEPAAARLRAAGLAGAHAMSVSRVAAGAGPRGAWCALRHGATERARFAVASMPAAVGERLRALAAGAARNELFERLALPAAATVARRGVSLGTLRSLVAGDVLLLPAAVPSLEGARAVLQALPTGGRGVAVAGRIEGQSFIAEGVLHMSDDAQDIVPDADDPADALGDLELPVRFEIETVAVPLCELEAIEPGYVIELAMPVADARLRLVSCGQVIGHAELVAVGDRLGARITRMVVRDDA